MSFMTRNIAILILALLLAAAGEAAAQATAQVSEETTTANAAPAQRSRDAAATESQETRSADRAEGAPADTDEKEETLTSSQVRERFSNLLYQSPPEVARVLTLDPALLSNQGYMSAYPHIQEFVNAHPEILRNPRYYLSSFEPAPLRRTSFDEFVDMFEIFGTFTLLAFALTWAIRTIIDHKRWSRLSKTQAEVHTKIMDRFGTSAELLEYMKTPAGSKFLESAPIALHSDGGTRPQNVPLSRTIWSVQIGVVIAAGALGMLLVSGRFEGESGHGLFAMGTIAFCVGAGFILSALVALFLSRRLGLVEGSEPAQPAFDETGRLVR